jgi:hypothetical protein
MKRSITAFLVAPIAPMLLYLLLAIISDVIFLAFVIFGIPIAYLAALIGGVPLYLVIKKRPHLQRWYICVVLAGLLGGLAMFLFMMYSTTRALEFSREVCLFGALGMAHGAISGLVFWRIIKPTLKPSNPEAISHA